MLDRNIAPRIGWQTALLHCGIRSPPLPGLRLHRVINRKAQVEHISSAFSGESGRFPRSGTPPWPRRGYRPRSRSDRAWAIGFLLRQEAFETAGTEVIGISAGFGAADKHHYPFTPILRNFKSLSCNQIIISADQRSRLHVSIASGRKTMGFCESDRTDGSSHDRGGSPGEAWTFETVPDFLPSEIQIRQSAKLIDVIRFGWASPNGLGLQ